MENSAAIIAACSAVFIAVLNVIVDVVQRRKDRDLRSKELKANQATQAHAAASQLQAVMEPPLEEQSRCTLQIVNHAERAFTDVVLTSADGSIKFLEYSSDPFRSGIFVFETRRRIGYLDPRLHLTVHTDSEDYERAKEWILYFRVPTGEKFRLTYDELKQVEDRPDRLSRFSRLRKFLAN